MRILSAEQIREWDQFTIDNEPVASIDLMERAAGACVDWILKNKPGAKRFTIFCGKGNNGGDGLAIARMLSETFEVHVYIAELGNPGTPDFQTNLQQLQKLRLPISFIQYETSIPQDIGGGIVIDALLGTGLNRKLDGLMASIVESINRYENEVLSIDIPSGMFADSSSAGNVVVRANHTLTFQCYKIAFLFASNEETIGILHVLDIGLHPDFKADSKFRFITRELVSNILQPRKKFSHKGNFGHALLVGGSYGKAGAIVLAAKAVMRSGAGLLTVHIPSSLYDILQISIPEAMVQTDLNELHISEVSVDTQRFTTIAIGPGLGTEAPTKLAMAKLLSDYRRPLVIDADGLNILSQDKSLLAKLPAGSILTPHPKEFERLFGGTENDFDRLRLAATFAKKLQVVIVLKGHHTAVIDAGEIVYFNTTGNPGMATGGSGDVLTGIIASLLSQGYEPIDAALCGVYLHGLAGDLALEFQSEESLLASDLIENIGQAYKSIRQ
jgi:ADP-dependent NAD(P)H-hydrate dehydratase / NAD(P)H-hydrate epimerase